MDTKLPVKWSELSPEEDSEVRQYFPSWPLNDCVKYEPGPVIMPRTFLPIADEVYNFELREDDIWIVTYPKVGTTWTQEIVWMLVNDVDKEAGAKPLYMRTPFLEFGCITAGRERKMTDDGWMNENLDPEVEGNEKNMEKLKKFANQSSLIQYANQMKGRRVIKTHMPMEFLPKQILETCKVVYVCRNVKDACVSYFNHNVNISPHDFQGDFEDFARMFKKDLPMYGSYWHHLLGGWKLRGHKNLKFIWYEDMKKDTKKVIEELCEFVEHPLSSEKVDALVDHVHVDNMRKNPWVNPPQGKRLRMSFIRKGKVGDSKTYFTAEREKEWNEWIKSKTEGTGINMTL